MSHTDFKTSVELSKKNPFAALLMAAMRSGELEQQTKLQKAFPAEFNEFVARQNSQDGKIDSDFA